MMMEMKRGGFVIGIVVGLLLGLVLTLGVALYIAKVPVPFVNKVPGRTAEQDNAEAERNRSWDPNAPLGSRNAAGRVGASASAPPPPTGGAGVVAPSASGVIAAVPSAAPPPVAAPAAPPAPGGVRDPAAILSGAPVAGGAAAATAAAAASAARSTAAAVEPFVFFVQAGAYTRNEDAEQQRAKLALMGHVAAISEREQAGRVVYRVRVGPFRTRDDADGLQVKLQAAAIESQIVRVERP